MQTQVLGQKVFQSWHLNFLWPLRIWRHQHGEKLRSYQASKADGEHRRMALFINGYSKVLILMGKMKF
jgi:hypothetical protein